MFVIATVADTIRVPAPLLFHPTLQSVNFEIEKKYPNRVIYDVGLVICRHGDALQIGDANLVAGDGGAHHDVIFRLVVFRPFVEEVCLGTITESTEEGIRISMGFFEDVFIPAYWMLRPSHYNNDTGLWVWTPNYNEGGDEGEEEGGEEEAAADENNQFEMEIGSEVRFKVKSINFTQVTDTAKGVQATTTTTAHQPNAASVVAPKPKSGQDSSGDNAPVRKRSTSVDLSDAKKVPASMHIVASICEDGLGLTSWWASPGEEEDGEEEERVKEEEDAEQI
uniref:RNA polymerase III subunit Rpc25 domain-containing protein n=2 Tax=Ditylum brightwellii TaxID=49249 RepID=A0A7S2EJI0_9STRA|mmetsp:Transcript_31745/g.47322  ORF Transcript_31745/g.47322 Transcript_31745/m.47322 type:complete len:280 (+) Transcript_31745:106-945(+)